MSMFIDILSKEDVEEIVRKMITMDPYFTTNLFSSFISMRYGITLEQFDKIVNSAIPEDMI